MMAWYESFRKDFMEVLAGLQASSTILEHPLNYHSHALALESDLARQGLELDVVVAEEL